MSGEKIAVLKAVSSSSASLLAKIKLKCIDSDLESQLKRERIVKVAVSSGCYQSWAFGVCGSAV